MYKVIGRKRNSSFKQPYDESQTSYDRESGPIKHISIEEYEKEKEKNEPNH